MTKKNPLKELSGTFSSSVKKTGFYACLHVLVIILFSAAAYAMPTIQNVAANPQSAYFGEGITLGFECTATTNIQDVYASITGPNVIIPNIQVSGGPSYSVLLDSAYIDRTGNFDAVVFCRDSESETNASVQFTVSQVTGGITSIGPAPTYSGDPLDIVFEIKKDNNPLINGVVFSLYLNGNQVSPKSVVFDTTKGWIIRIDAPPSAGNHAIKVIAAYDRVNVTSEKTIDVKNPVQLSIASLDRTRVVAGDNVSIKISALEEGNLIQNGNFRVYLDSGEVSVNKLTNDGQNWYAEITMPGIKPRAYTLKVTMDYRSSVYTSQTGIEYIIPVSGAFVEGGKALNVQIRFLKGSAEKLKISTDGSGRYSTSVVPDTYDVEIAFPESKLTLERVDMEKFDDPVKYSYIADVKIPGIAGGGIYVFDVLLDFDRAVVEIPYKEGAVDEEKAKLFRCSSWNSARKECSANWVETNANIDVNRNVATLVSSSLSAFTLGTKESITVNFNAEKRNYALRDVVRIRGNTQDSARNPIPNAKIDIRLGTSTVGNLASDNNGVFSVEFLAPDVENNYTITISAEKTPYLKGEKTSSIEVIKLRSLSILFPESVRVSPGETVSKDVIIINTGQDDISGAELRLEGLPESYHKINVEKASVPVNGQEKFSVEFSIPEDAEERTYPAALKIVSDKVTKEKSFGFTVAKEEIAASPATGFATNLEFSLPTFDITYLYLAGFALVSFSLAVFLKKRKTSPKELRQADTQSITDIKNHFRSAERLEKYRTQQKE